MDHADTFILSLMTFLYSSLKGANSCATTAFYIVEAKAITLIRLYHIAGMFGGVNVWQIAEFKEIGEIKFGKLIYFSHNYTIYKLILAG